jgi:DNA-binding response OmpR family regulator
LSLCALTHSWLLKKVWGEHYGSESQYLRVFIRQLRSKLRDDPSRQRFIVTEPGLGYRWNPTPHRARNAAWLASARATSVHAG